MRRAIALFGLLATAVATTPAPPMLPNQFSARVVMTVPIIGQISGTMYYDMALQAQRVDSKGWFGTSIALDLYDYNVHYDINAGMCVRKDSNDTIPEYALPPQPLSFFVENTTIGNVRVQHWRVTLPSMQFDWFIDASDPKNAQLVRWTSDTFGVQFTMDFSSQQAGPQDASLFDPAQWGCPAPVPPRTWSVAGFVKDAVTARAVAGASVTLGSLVATTDSDGLYTFASVVEGAYSLSASAAGYTTSPGAALNVTSSIAAGSSADVSLSPVLQPGQARAVLTWGPTPRDLDSHAFVSSTDGYRCHVWYSSRSCANVSLDRDATQGYGPETITMSAATGYKVAYWVYIYTQGGVYDGSGAMVTIYHESGPRVLKVPSGAGTNRWWNVFALTHDGISIVNKIDPAGPPA